MDYFPLYHMLSRQWIHSWGKATKRRWGSGCHSSPPGSRSSARLAIMMKTYSFEWLSPDLTNSSTSQWRGFSRSLLNKRLKDWGDTHVAVTLWEVWMPWIMLSNVNSSLSFISTKSNCIIVNWLIPNVWGMLVHVGGSPSWRPINSPPPSVANRQLYCTLNRLQRPMALMALIVGLGSVGMVTSCISMQPSGFSNIWKIQNKIHIQNVMTVEAFADDHTQTVLMNKISWVFEC